nr:MAG TPA_asm: hypothetical protein [Caudoviricetes sp.]
MATLSHGVMQDKARSVIYVSAPGLAIPEDNND